MKAQYWFFAAVILSTSFIEACTGLKLVCQDGRVVHGRTLEFGTIVDSSVVFVPRNYSFTATTPLGKGMTYQSKYAAVGTICFNKELLMDGINEMGLSVGTFYFPGYANYTPTTRDNANWSLSPIDFPNWIVTQFATLDEVKNNVKNVVISPTVDSGWGTAPAPFHYIIYDKSGKSLVIEPIHEKLVITENELGVFTNSPTFDWQMTNLRNYINLRPENVQPIKIEDVELTPFSQGSGLLGLPGDFTSPSRFVRASIFFETAKKPENNKEGVYQLFHILNQFDIPLGTTREVTKQGKVFDEFTQATVVRDPAELKYYFRTYNNQNIEFIDLNAFDKNGSKLLQANTASMQTVKDVSNELKPR